MLASYEADFAAQWGRKARMILEEFGQPLFGVSVSKKSSAADRWDIDGYPGGMQTAGVGGPLTGKGADLLLIDDPIKNSEEAGSETMRNKTWDWFTSTAYTRLEPKGACVVIQTRWNEDDLAGRLIDKMNKGGEKWEVLNLPAIAESNDAIGRSVGQALWPERYDEKELARIQKAVGSRVWASLYQQRPTPEDGDVFKRSWFRKYERDGNWLITKEGRFNLAKCGVFATMDLAISEKTSADYTVIQAWAVTDCNRAFLLGQYRDHVKSGQHIPALKAMVKRYRCDWVGIESVAFQFEIVRQARQAGLTVKKLVPKGDKLTRAHAAAPRMEAGMVFFPDEPWVADLESELLTFPNGKHDDQVDTLAYALLDIHRRAGGLEAA